MKVYKITLLSDACISSGDISGTNVDRDACYDSYGLPYIPAKRIKGCLREAAEEIVDWYQGKDEDKVGILFGIGDNGESKKIEEKKIMPQLFITDACLEKIKEKHNQILWAKEQGYGEFVNTQNLIDNYTYIRYQTAMEEEQAKRNSLRSTRVVKKGTEFYFQCNVDEFDNSYVEFFNQCCLALRHMGSSRSRGLGHIKIEDCRIERTESQSQDLSNICLESDKKYCIEFDIELNTPMIFPKHSIGCPSTETYIPGSSLMGYFANQYKIKHPETQEETFETLFLSGNIIFENAYITHNGLSTQPVSLSWYKEKGKSVEQSVCYEMLYRENRKENSSNERPKLEWIGDNYCSIHFDSENIISTIDLISVNKTLGYHYKGNINKNYIKENEMFQIIGIEKNQTFRARIIGDGNYLSEILPFVINEGVITLGTSKSAQYGRGIMHVKKNFAKEIELTSEQKRLDKIVLLLNSPLILFDETKLSYSADIGLLRMELERILGIARKDGQAAIECLESRIRYKTIGGYNTKWRLVKENITAMDAGSVFVFQCIENRVKMDVSSIQYQHMGEKINEGFGAFTLYPYESMVDNPVIKKVMDTNKNTVPNVTNLHDFTELKDILIRRFGKEIRNIARKNAEFIFNSQGSCRIIEPKYTMSSAAVNKALLQLENKITLYEFLVRQKSIKDKEKLGQSIVCMWLPKSNITEIEINKLINSPEIDYLQEQAINFLDKIKKEILKKYDKAIQDFFEESKIENDYIFNEYMQELLLQAKLILRKSKKIEMEV